MSKYYRISTTTPEVQRQLADLDFPTYESAEAAIQFLPSGIYLISPKLITNGTNNY